MTSRDLPPPVPVTALRVYEPLEAFPAPRRPALAAIADDPDAARGADAAERWAAWRAVLGRRSDAAGGSTVRARVLRAEGAVLLCPIELPRREAGAPGDLPAAGVAGAGDPAEAGGAGTGGAGTGGAGTGPGTSGGAGPAGYGEPGEGGHSLVRAWELPTAWLAIVRAEDLTRSGGQGRYVLPMSRARARSARAVRALREGVGDVEVTMDAEALARWLERFHSRSWVEVDARPVAALVGGEDGADDVRLGLECLTVGDAAGVAAAYRRMSKRSHRLEELSVSS